MELVSVIIPTYNRSAYLREAIESVLSQTYKNIELIVVDDGSTDATGELLLQHGAKLSVLHTGHRGPSAARNCGIAAASGAHIAFLDSDDVWLPDKLREQMLFFQDHPEARVCQTEEIWIRNGVRVNPMNKHKKYSGWIFERCLPLCIVSPSAVMIERSVFTSAGLFDETFLACEDYDLWLRISARYPVFLLDTPLIIKRGGHNDQQSKIIPHLDQYRIRALCKILESNLLQPDQHRQALAELKKKCRIYGSGCLKRGRKDEGEQILKLPENYLTGC
jgi:glycosyltransferase involved in cell wall biosynthesis